MFCCFLSLCLCFLSDVSLRDVVVHVICNIVVVIVVVVDDDVVVLILQLCYVQTQCIPWCLAAGVVGIVLSFCARKSILKEVCRRDVVVVP